MDSQSNPMDDILTQIDNIKEKLSSDEYKNLLETLQKVHNDIKKVRFEVIFASVYFEVERIDVYIKPQIRRIVLEQPAFSYLFHQKDGDYYKIPYKFFMNALTKENKQIIENILFVDCKDERYEDYDCPKADICYDVKDCFYVRFLEGDMNEPPSDLDDSFSEDESSTEG